MAREIVGEIFLNVKPLDGGVNVGVQKIIDAATDQSAKVPVTADTKKAEEAVARLGGQIQDDVGTAWLAAAAQAAAFTAGIVGMKRAIEGVVGKLAGTFDQLAQAQAGFTSILGSESGGSRLLDEIREFARVSPFVTQELVNYSQQLLGVGKSAESIVPLLEDVGNVVASVGGDTGNISRVLFTLTQIQTIGRLTGQDAMQLQSSLIPITKMLSEFLGKTTAEVKKLQEQGLISAETVFAAISQAGEGAAGAMAGATRNIAGARSVLTDTITIMAQDSEFLQAVFQDIVDGILAFSTALGEPEIKETLDNISKNLNDAYTALQPLIQGFSELSGSLGISALKVFGSAIEILAAALNSMPPGALELFGQALAVYATLKIPIALISYVENIRRLVGIDFSKILSSQRGMADGINNTTTAARNAALGQAGLADSINNTDNSAKRTTVSLKGHEVQITALALAAGAAALVIGQLTKAMFEENEAAQTIGDTLTGAGIGAQIGAAFSPAGAIAGAGIGAGIGLVTSFVTNAREEAERRTEEMEEIGAKIAKDLNRGFEITNPGGLKEEEDFEDYFGLLKPFQAAIDKGRVLQDQLDTLNATVAAQRFGINGDVGRDQDIDPAIFGQIEAAEAALAEFGDQGKQAKINLDELFASRPEGLQLLQDKLAALNKDIPAFGDEISSYYLKTRTGLSGLEFATQGEFNDTLIATGQAAALSSLDFEQLTSALETAGLTTEDLIRLTHEELVILYLNDLPLAINESRKALNEFNLAVDENQKAQDEFFNDFEKQIARTSKNREGLIALAGAFDKVVASADAGNLSASDSSGFATKLLEITAQVSAAAGVLFDDPAKGRESGLSFALTQLEELRTELGKVKFDEFIRTSGLTEFYAGLADSTAGFTGTVKELSESLGVPIERVQTLLGLSKELSEKGNISIDTNFLEMVTELEALRNYIPPTSSGIVGVQQRIKELEAAVQEFVTTGAVQAIPGTVDKAVKETVSILSNYIGEIHRLQSSLAAGSGLGDAFETLIATGEGQSQYASQLISTFDAIASAGVSVYGESRAQANALSFIRTNLEDLQAQTGQTDDQFREMLASLNLLDLYTDSLGEKGGFTGTIADAATELGVTNEALIQLLGLQESINTNTVITYTADVTAAIAELQRLDEASAASGLLESDRTIAKRKKLNDLIAASTLNTDSSVLEDIRKAEADKLAEEQKRAAEIAQREAERLAEEARREAERLAEEAAREAERLVKAYEDAGEAMSSAIESAASSIKSAAASWVASIKERTQDERAVSIERLLRNATNQRDTTGELNTGLAALQNRGLSAEAAGAIGLDSITDIRQVRKLLAADSSSLVALSQIVGQRDANAEAIAKRQQQAETQATIVAAIKEAATALGFKVTDSQAIQLSAQINVDGSSTGDSLPTGLLEALMNVGQIVRTG